MKITLLLADFAQVVNGKLYIMGGGWSVTGPNPVPSAIAIKLEVPWDEANKPHKLKLVLVDADGRPVIVRTPAGDKPLELGGDFEVGRPPGVPPGVSLDIMLAYNIAPLPLQPNGRYVWRVFIDEDSKDDWQVAFTTRPAQKAS